MKIKKQESNVGKLGVESIRLGGMQIGSLPMREDAIAKEQLPESYKTDRENQIEQIKGKYPKQTVDWVLGAIKDAENSIRNVQKMSADQQAMIGEYSGHISLCEYRDKEIKRLTTLIEDKTELSERVRELKLNFPPYDVDKMKIQIGLCEEAIQRANAIVEQEHKTISELRDLLAECTRRDNELKKLGA